jgi:zinc/manganese transport system substrate-binding protein
MAALAADLRVSLSEFDPMETGSTDPQAYFQVMNQNLNNIEKALGVKEVP